MKKTLFAFALVAALPAGMALADDDDCSVPRADWQSRDAVARVAEENGWTVRKIEVDDGCYEIYARDSDGRLMEVEIHPATLQVLEIEYEEGYARSGTSSSSSTNKVAPPQNGLFGNGAAPQVKVN